MPRVDVGPVADIPTDRCIAIADGRAIVARHKDTIVAFPNRCLHQNSTLAGGRTAGGLMICPHHFWQYRIADGAKLDEPDARLEMYSVEIVDDRVFVDVPEPKPDLSMAEFLRGFAKGDLTADDFPD